MALQNNMFVDTIKKISFPILFSILIFGCSPKIHKNFENNRYVNNYSLHIINDSLKLYFKTPADIEFVRDKKELRKIVRRSHINFQNKLLAYGKTDFPPYEFFMTLGNKPFSDKNHNLVVLDTMLSGKRIHFIGNSLSQSSGGPLLNDLTSALRSLQVGNGYRKNITSVMDVVQKYKESNKFYYALDQIQQFPAYDKAEEWARFQMEITYASFLGANSVYERLLEQFESAYKPKDSIKSKIKEAAVYNNNALDKIIQEANRHQIIMINENHFYPNHRLLITALLSKLKAIGYDVLALEALGNNQDKILNQDEAYPTLKTGFYTSEQNFANLIREAKSLGYKFLAYEDNEGGNREANQAKMLYEKTFKVNPKEKVVVLGGIDHILEEPTKGGTKRMAAVFKEEYGIDPLTVSQTHLSYYRRFFDEDYILSGSKVFSDTRLTSVDYHLLNNKSSDLSLWKSTYEYENKNDFAVQVSLFYSKELTHKTDYNNKIPYFTTIVKEREKIVLPINPDERIYLYSYDKKGNRIDKMALDPEDHQ